MKYRSTVFIALIFCTALLSASVVTDDPFSLLIKRVEDYVRSNPQEKVHLHLDKPYYAIGDDIWFKAYVVDTRNSEPSTLSGVLYVELINERDSLKRQLRIPLTYGLGWGDFHLPDSLSEGNYRIRAYTQLMRNMAPEFFFDKTIKVGNSWTNQVFATAKYDYNKGQDGNEHMNATLGFTDKDKKPYLNTEVSYQVQVGGKLIATGKATTNAAGEMIVGLSKLPELSNTQGRIIAAVTLPNKRKVVKTIPLTALSNEVDVQFFPEGGNLVEGLPARIGIKAIGPNGLGKSVEGSIVDDEGTPIAGFKAFKLGMTNFSMTPQPNRRYAARIKFEDGSERLFNLPSVRKSGYALQVNNSGPEQVMVRMMCSADLLNKGEMKLMAQHQGNVYMISKAVTTKQIATANIPRKSLPSGIIQLTLFSPENLPVCERLVFVNHEEDKIKTMLKSDQETYAKRQQVKMELAASTTDKPVQGSFSVAVTNTVSVAPDLDNESNILSSLLLTSDLFGYVEKPNSYFTDNSPETKQALDNLMLTQGWRRIVWKNIIDNAAPTALFQPERSMTISGTITQSKKPVPNAKVSLVSSKGGLFMLDTLTDAAGRFVFDKLDFADSTKFVVQARYGKDKKFVDIQIDKQPGQLISANKNTGDIEVNVNESIQSYLAKSENFFEQQMKRGLLTKTILLNEVKIVAEKPNLAPNSSNLNGPGKADFVFGPDALEGSTTVTAMLRTRLPGISFISGVPYLERSKNTNINKLTPMLLMLDGIRIDFSVDEESGSSDNADLLDNIPASNIESIEVLRSGHYTAIYGQRGGGGVIIITSKSGRSGAFNSYTPGLITYMPKGFYPAREFYSPKYDVKSNNLGPDSRTTVYWNPNVATDAQGKGTFSFYAADDPGEYRVVIEGIEKGGKLARQVYTYQVK